jgi:uncharacterized protein
MVTGPSCPQDARDARTPSPDPLCNNAPVASPCRGTCTYDTVSGWCLDCGRLGSEIGEWLHADTARRLEIRAAAAVRMAAVGRP